MAKGRYSGAVRRRSSRFGQSASLGSAPVGPQPTRPANGRTPRMDNETADAGAPSFLGDIPESADVPLWRRLLARQEFWVTFAVIALGVAVTFVTSRFATRDEPRKHPSEFLLHRPHGDRDDADLDHRRHRHFDRLDPRALRRRAGPLAAGWLAFLGGARAPPSCSAPLSGGFNGAAHLPISVSHPSWLRSAC